MVRAGLRLGLLCGVLAALSVAAAPAAGAEDPAPRGRLALEGEPSRERFGAGEQVRLRYTVTNEGRAACTLPTVPEGSLAVTAVTRDGKGLTPRVAPVLQPDGPGPVVYRTVEEVAAGGTATVGLDAVDAGPETLAVAFRTVTWSPEAGTIQALWPLGAPGEYAVTARYAPPPAPGRPAKLCRGASGAVTLRFTVTDQAPPAGRPRPPAWPLVGAVVAVGAFLIYRRRSRSPGPGRPPRTPGAPGGGLLALVLLVTTGGLVVADTPPALATIKPPGGAAGVAFQRCMNAFRAEDGSGDPLGIIPFLEFSPHRVVVRHNRGDSMTSPAGDAWDKAGNGTGVGSDVLWNPDHRGPLTGGVAADPCAELYHELFHAWDNAHGTLDLRQCPGAVRGLRTAEVRATLAENAYRRFHGLPERTVYGDMKLPESAAACDRPDAGAPTFPRVPGPSHNDCPAAGCAGSDGDPHLMTFDGLAYDLQAAGEFTAVRSAGGGPHVQVRQVPYPGSTLVAINAAVAAEVAGDRVGLYLGEGGIGLRVNGAAVPVPGDGLRLPGGGQVARRVEAGLETYRVSWPDGSSLWTHVVGTWGLNVRMRLAAEHAGRVQGLFGDFDGDPDDDLVTATGAALPADAPFARVHAEFGDSWRIRQADSLFDYAPGEDTGTFTLRDFPEQPVTLDTVPGADTARVLCRAAGVPAGPSFSACVIDAAITGQAHFVSSAANTPEPGTGVRLVRDGELVEGEITAPAQRRRYRVDLDGATSFAIADWRGTGDACDQTFTIDLVGVSTGNFPCAGGHAAFTVPDPDRPHEVEIAPAAGGTGPFRFRLVTVKPRTLPTAIGRSVEDGRLEVRGRVDLHEFAPDGARSVRLTGLPGCEAGIFADLRDVTTGTVLSGNNALCGEQVGPFELPDPGHRYAIAIRSADLATERYAFRLRAG